ncbi:hypothetical protein HYH03_011075 [Edaphochlamys debaryana]|uniref:Uncharacterized protein n=1 Tax=Edaphochlamys debaryana TaxID=47281 RepID=A0A835XVA3_9CHLO|nr:hypothetical protein HYH03_011075 [Edaphochlamys debaryana]|eukprot:KAG2490439.1 hypothetical protein HYH03_011075 [Edaphochlamys debaryana]
MPTSVHETEDLAYTEAERGDLAQRAQRTLDRNTLIAYEKQLRKFSKHCKARCVDEDGLRGESLAAEAARFMKLLGETAKQQRECSYVGVQRVGRVGLSTIEQARKALVHHDQTRRLAKGWESDLELARSEVFNAECKVARQHAIGADERPAGDLLAATAHDTYTPEQHRRMGAFLARGTASRVQLRWGQLVLAQVQLAILLLHACLGRASDALNLRLCDLAAPATTTLLSQWPMRRMMSSITLHHANQHLEAVEWLAEVAVQDLLELADTAPGNPIVTRLQGNALWQRLRTFYKDPRDALLQNKLQSMPDVIFRAAQAPV